MIIDAIFSVILAVPNALLGALGSVSLSIPGGFIQGLGSVFSSINYFVPIRSLLPIVVIELAVIGFKIIWAIVLRVKSFIPSMGA